MFKYYKSKFPKIRTLALEHNEINRAKLSYGRVPANNTLFARTVLVNNTALEMFKGGFTGVLKAISTINMIYA